MSKNPGACRPRDMGYVPRNLTVRFGLKAPFDAESLLELSEAKDGQVIILDYFGGEQAMGRVLAFDKSAGRLAQAAISSIARKQKGNPDWFSGSGPAS